MWIVDCGLWFVETFQQSTISIQQSSVHLSHHDIDRSNDRRNVREKHVSTKLGRDGEIDEAWAADLDAVGDGAALAFDVEAEMAARVFVFRVNLAGRDLHVPRELGAEGAGGNLLDALA